jgi:hypothetical protein
MNLNKTDKSLALRKKPLAASPPAPVHAGPRRKVFGQPVTPAQRRQSDEVPSSLVAPPVPAPFLTAITKPRTSKIKPRTDTQDVKTSVISSPTVERHFVPIDEIDKIADFVTRPIPNLDTSTRNK